jgi:hypothetical protein
LAKLYRNRDTPADGTDGTGFDEQLAQALAPIMEEYSRQMQSAIDAYREETLVQAGCTPDGIAKIRRVEQARANWRWN